jgi:tetratricopeptide (TPR) repeat protein
LVCYDKAIAVRPEFAPPYVNRGVALQALQRYAQALKSYDQALVLAPQLAQAHNNRGNVLKALGRMGEAIQSYQAAIAADPHYAEGYYNLGVGYGDIKDLPKAIAAYDQAIALDPQYVQAWLNRGNAWKDLGQMQRARQDYESILKINSCDVEALSNLGVIYQDQGAMETALVCYEQALQINPQYAQAYSNRGNVLKDLGLIDASIQSHDRAIALDPDYADAYWNKSISLLLKGDWDQGWSLYEWRFKRQNGGRARRELMQPQWHGETSIAGQRILLYAEQGLGDTLQFCRYVSRVAEMGAHVILEVQRPLLNVMQTLQGVHTLVVQGDTLPEFDVQCSLMSLPLALKITPQSVGEHPPYLFADPNKANVWQTRLAQNQRAHPCKAKVGLVWNGGFRANMPEMWGVNARRNIGLSAFAAALQHSDVAFYSLQKGDPAESEIRGQALRYWPYGNFYDVADELKDFSDTAALIAHLDLVISVDTSTAHLAAAMNRPVWLLNRFDTCWRWLTQRVDTPWYPSMTLYRQGPQRQWDDVLQQVANDLTHWNPLES